MTDVDPRSLLPLTDLAFQLLLALADRERHGYGILLEIEKRTDGLVRLRTGTLYTLLQRLVEEHLIEELSGSQQPGGDERRRYYGLTALGRGVLRAEAQRLEAVVKDARRKSVLGRSPKA